MITVGSPVTTVLGDSRKRTKIDRLGLRTVGDLLAHFPRTYLRTGELTRVDELAPGQQLTVVGRIASSQTHEYADRRRGGVAYRVEVRLATDGPSLQMVFFAKQRRMAQWHADRLPVGAEGVFTGKVRLFKGDWQLTNPEMVIFDRDRKGTARAAVDRLRGLYPVYPLTAGLASLDVQRAVAFALTVLDEVPDLVPDEVRASRGLLDAFTALERIHSPDDWAELEQAKRRFRFEEALVTQLVLARRRAAVRRLGTQPRRGGGELLAAFDAALPFRLTPGQSEVCREIEEDLARRWPMNRLLQGEVGSGKTVVAVRAMLRVIDSGGQAALLAPTEVLAQQHYRSITALLGDLATGGMLGGSDPGTSVALLTGSMSRQARRAALLRVADGEAGIVVGTHALLQEHVVFADLGLVVVDEQHRFGVEQRAVLTGKADQPPHLLVMTATPIPRTVAMTVFGDLETSTLSELPAGRAAVQTTVVPVRQQPGWMTRVWSRVREEVGRGHQVYVVCPRIGGEAGDVAEEGEHDQVDYDEDGQALLPAPGEDELPAAVEEVVRELGEGALAGLRLAPLHGRLGSEVKDRTMREFAAGAVDVLVSTTVIEVGVDVRNATTMVVLDAERFGVSQLHQLRGRVGRGELPGLCLLVTTAARESAALRRLEAVAAISDGFELSTIDLETRREGDVLGASQSGYRSSLRRLRVLRDEQTILEARADAERLLAADPELSATPLLAAAVDAMERSTESDFMERS